MSKADKILIVEDDATIRTILELALMGDGYTNVASVARGDEALGIIKNEKSDLVLLDVMLPGLDGYQIATQIRASSEIASTRIIMLTARSEPEDIIRGLESGADDYVTKPFDRKILMARVKAVLRRGSSLVEGADFDGLRLDTGNRRATLRGEELALTGGEFELLARLVAHRGRILTRAAYERSIDVQIVKLRQKLGDWASHIETVRGVGYRVK